VNHRALITGSGRGVDRVTRRVCGQRASGVGERVEQRQQLGSSLRDGSALPRDGLLVASGDRARERPLSADLDPVFDGRTYERCKQVALDASGRGQSFRRSLERDEEVGGDRRSGVVDGAVVIRDRDRAHSENSGKG
jgi:hypothetical protein